MYSNANSILNKNNTASSPLITSYSEDPFSNLSQTSRNLNSSNSSNLNHLKTAVVAPTTNAAWPDNDNNDNGPSSPSIEKISAFATTTTAEKNEEIGSSSAEIFQSSPEPSSLLAFNGNTYVRPNRKERKGLYFSPEVVGSSGGSDPGGETKTGPTATTTTTAFSDTNGTSCSSETNVNKKIIPSLKFSTPSTSEEDTLELRSPTDQESPEKMTNRVTGSSLSRSSNSTSVSATSSSVSSPENPKNSVGTGRTPKVPNRKPEEVGFEAEEDLLGLNGILNPLSTSTPTKSNVGNVSASGGGGGLNRDFNTDSGSGGHYEDHRGNQPQQDQSHSLSNTSNEENFECFGEGSESFTTESTSLQNFRDLNESDILSSPGGGGVVGDGIPPPSLSRQGWQRNSLRRTPNPNSLNGDGMNHRRWGSFRTSSKRGAPVVPSSKALANELYRSSSYHSSGRSSAGDGEEMYSDSSLEGEVIDLTKKVHHLEEKFTVLAENQNDVDDRYTRAKQENAELSTKLFMFEEQLREVELRADEKLREETRRHKEALSRFEREKQLQIENYEIKSQMLEKDFASSKIEVKRLEGTLERERNEKNRLADKYGNVEREISAVREQNRELLNQNRIDRETMAMESAGSQQALVELKKQLEGLSHFHLNSSSNSFRRNDSTESESSELKSRLREADEEIRRLKNQNKQLQETNEELSGQILNQGLENGRILLKELNTSGAPGGNSLAAEFEAMSIEEMKSALKDQKEANLALRSYIDGILLNIVEHYPQLLEVKNKNSSGGTITSEPK